MKHIILTSIAAAIALLSSAQTNVNIEINHMLNGNSMLSTQIGTNNLEEDFEVRRLDYYLSQFSLTYDGGQTMEFENLYALVDGLVSTTINLGEIDASNIETLTFYIGVDQANNHEDPAGWPNDHPLAPQNPSMHWGWAAGYRFVALEGTDIATDQDFELHGLEDENYFSVTLPVNVSLSSDEITLMVSAHCEEIVNDVELALAPLAHGGYGMALRALENMADYVFEYQGTSVGVSEAFPDVSFNVYPNPTTNGMAQIIVDGMNNERIDVQVFDILGKSVFEASGISNGKNTELNLTRAGMYIVRISTNGMTIATQKLVVQ